MSIATQLQALETNISNAYDMVSQRGGTVPARKNMENLDNAIATIPSGTPPSSWIPRETDANGVYGYALSSGFSFKIPNGTDVLDSYSLSYACGRNSNTVTIPNVTSIDFNGVKYARQSSCLCMATSNTRLTTVTGLSNLIGVNATVQSGCFQSAFSGCYNLVGNIDLSSFVGVESGSSATASSFFTSAFKGTSITGVDLSSFNANSTAFSGCLNSTFSGCYSLTAVDLSSLTSILSATCFGSTFEYCSTLPSVDLSNLTKIDGNGACSGTFRGCTALQTMDLSSLTEIGGDNGCYEMFSGCSHLSSVDLSALTKISGTKCCQRMFRNCTNLTSMTFSVLSDLQNSDGGLYSMFQGCTSLSTLSFPSLTVTSFGSYTNQFNNMLQGVTGCTVHFPSAIQSTISGWTDVTNGFGGTNTTVLFDL